MKAVILAGGLGRRLRPLTDTIPKPMVPVAGKPILQWQMEWLKTVGVDEFILCIGHLREKVMEFFGDGASLGVKVRYVIEEEPLGTGGALKNASAHFPKAEPFFCLNGDVISDLDLHSVLKASRTPGAVGALSLVPLPSPYGTVVTGPGGYVTDFKEKPRLTDHWINAGVYCLQPSVAGYLPQRGSLEIDVFPKLAREHKLLSFQYPSSFWMSMDSPKDIEEAGKVLEGPQRPVSLTGAPAQGS